MKNIPTKNLSLLHLAAITDSLEVFIYITKYKKVNPLIQSYDNYNPLHYACLGNSIEVATYIISHFPDLPSHDTPTKLQYIYFTKVSLMCRLDEAYYKCECIYYLLLCV